MTNHSNVMLRRLQASKKFQTLVPAKNSHLKVSSIPFMHNQCHRHELSVLCHAQLPFPPHAHDLEHILHIHSVLHSKIKTFVTEVVRA